MKKTAKILLYFVIIALVVWTIYFKEGINAFMTLLHSDEGLLLSLFNKITSYFQHADTLNLIFLVVFLCLSLISFVVVDRIWRAVFTWMRKTNPRLDRLYRFPLLIEGTQKMLSVVTLGIFFILFCNALIVGYGKFNSTDAPEQIKTPKPVLVLGTRKRLLSGKGENLYYTYRIDAAIHLWKIGKADYFIISGDRAGEHYDETRDIMSDLVLRGVPTDKVRLDTAGYRTLDSMLRIREMYRTRELVIISQEFHVQRALLLAKFYGMNAIGFSAKGSATTDMLIREFFSKPKVILDLILFNMQPKVLVDSNATKIAYREDFKVTSNLHVVFLITLATAFFSTLGLVYKHLD